MKVVHLTSAHAHNDVRIFSKECVSLAGQGFDVALIAPGTKDCMESGVRIMGVPKVTGRLRRMFLTSLRVYQRARREKADVYHFHDPEMIPWGLLLKLRGAKVVYDVHEDVPKQIMAKPWINPVLRKPIAGMFSLIERIFTRRMGIVAATPSIARKFPVDNTVIVQNFPKISEFVHSNASDYLERPNNIAYIGGITKVRGIVEMVSAMQYVKPSLNVTLLLGGKFDSEALVKDISHLVGWQKTRRLGYISRTEIVTALSRSRAGLVVIHPSPNHLESLPIKMFEYMAAGLPVIASDFPLWHKMLSDVNCALFVDPQDPKAISSTIEWLLNHPRDAMQMGQRGRKAILERYNWEHEQTILIRYYKQLL